MTALPPHIDLTLSAEPDEALVEHFHRKNGGVSEIAAVMAQRDALACELANERAWSDIASAPKDDTEVLIDTLEHGVLKSRWTKDHSWISQWGFDDWINVFPLCWRPLPEPPEPRS